MAVQIQIRRDTAAAWVAANPVLANGEIGVETDTKLAKLGNGMTAWNSLSYWPESGGATESRIVYDTLSQGMKAYPLTVPALYSTNQASAPRVVNNWALFSKGKWLVENHTLHTETVHAFTTMQDYVDWKNANIPHSGGVPDLFTEDVCLKPFDVVDSTIPVVSRMYGYNEVYIGVKGRHYRSGFPHAGPGSWNPALLKAIWETLFPWTIGLITEVDFGQNAGGRKACWLPSNWTKMYSMPKVGEIVQISSQSSGRYSGCENWENFNPVRLGTYAIDAVFGLIVHGDGTWEWCYFEGEGLKRTNIQIFEHPDGACLTVYRLYRGTEVGEREVAVYIKPQGINQVWLNYYDESKYDLEIVWVQEDMQKSLFRRIDPSEFFRPAHPNSGVCLWRGSWTNSHSRYALNLWHVGYQNRPDAYFRYRNKATGKVGPLSRSKIRCFVGQTNAPVKFMVV